MRTIPAPEASVWGIFASLPIAFRGKQYVCMAKQYVPGMYGSGLVAGDKNSSIVREVPVSFPLSSLSRLLICSFMWFSVVLNGVLWDARNL